jgi:hypothetical protein
MAISMCIAVGAVLATAPAGAATNPCGFACANVSNLSVDAQTGWQDYIQNAATWTLGGAVDLAPTSDVAVTEDFTPDIVDTVANLCAAGILPGTSVACLHYGSSFAYEMEFSPGGFDTYDLCVGVVGTPRNGEPVTLQPCGETASTIWIAAKAYARFVPRFFSFYTPWINGADTSFQNAQVLTIGPRVAKGSQAGDISLHVAPLSRVLGQVVSAQMFTVSFGPVA